jgi:hypothetical protein
MADRQKTSWVNVEVATQNTGKQKSSQIVVEVATQNTGKQKSSQIVIEVAYKVEGGGEVTYGGLFFGNG